MPIVVPEHWPTAWVEMDLSAYREGFLVGREAAEWIFQTLSGPEPIAVWALADGDVCWWCYEELRSAAGIQPLWLDRLDRTSGLGRRDTERLGEAFEQAARAAPARPLIYHGGPVHVPCARTEGSLVPRRACLLRRPQQAQAGLRCSLSPARVRPLLALAGGPQTGGFERSGRSGSPPALGLSIRCGQRRRDHLDDCRDRSVPAQARIEGRALASAAG